MGNWRAAHLVHAWVARYDIVFPRLQVITHHIGGCVRMVG